MAQQPDFNWRVGDTGSPLEVTLQYENGKDAFGRALYKVLDLTGAESITFELRATAGATPVVSQPATVTGAPTAGQVSYTPTDGTATATAGNFLGTFVVVDSFGVVKTYPTPANLLILVVP